MNGTILRKMSVLWIPGQNPQFIAGVTNLCRANSRLSSRIFPNVHINGAEIAFFNSYNTPYGLFSNGTGLIIMGSVWLLSLIYWIAAIPRIRKKQKLT